MQIKNIFIHLLYKYVSLFSKHAPDRTSFLIVSTTGLGDTLWATPAIRALRQTYPSASIYCLTSPLGAQVLKNNPHLTKIVVLGKPTLISLFSLLLKLGGKKWSSALIFHASQRAVFPLVTLLRPAELIGSAELNKGLDFLFTHLVDKREEHEIERRLRLVGAVGGKVDGLPTLEIALGQKEKEKAATVLRSKGMVVGLHPGAKDKFKQWPPEHFIKLGNLLKEYLGCEIVVSGSRNERQLVQKIQSGIPGAHAVGEGLTIQELAAFLQTLSLLITNDTGPLHLALAVQTPTLSLFTPTDHRLCGPYKVEGTVIQKEKTCTPCLKKKCQDPFCLRQISVESVLVAALKKLELPKFSG